MGKVDGENADTLGELNSKSNRYIAAQICVVAVTIVSLLSIVYWEEIACFLQ